MTVISVPFQSFFNKLFWKIRKYIKYVEMRKNAFFGKMEKGVFSKPSNSPILKFGVKIRATRMRKMAITDLPVLFWLGSVKDCSVGTSTMVTN